MIAALATLVFLLTLWMLTVVGAEMFEKNGAKILAALKREIAEPALRTRPVRIRPRRLPRLARITPRLRAAA